MTLIQQLAEQVGFHASYIDSFGQEVYANDVTRSALLSAMGYDMNSDDAINDSITTLKETGWRQLLPPVQVIKSENSTAHIPVTLAAVDGDTLLWSITTETGAELTGAVSLSELQPLAEQQLVDGMFNRYQLVLPTLPEGYHTLEVTVNDQRGSSHLIVAPKSCYGPNDVADFKMWGLAAQLYSLKSDNSWGLGDFGDLKNLVEKAADRGVSAIGLNPLHPLYPDNPAHISPYSPTSRCFLNSLYIDVTQAPNYAECKRAKTRVNSADFQAQLDTLNQASLIDYPHAAACKFEVLEMLYQDFEKQHLGPKTKLAREFARFKQEMGDELKVLATFDALYEHFRKQDFHAFGWQHWPADFQDPRSNAVKQFQRDNQSRIGYFEYLQWLADRQLGAAAEAAKQGNMAVGLYLDLAVGCDGGGADVWADQAAYVPGAAVGAPPDQLNTLGQDWGLTPMNPVALQEQGYQPLIKALRSNMRYAGALRIDHVLGLMRQYWVAPGMKADEGIYITFPLEDILRVIALESRRNQCVVIGEDLGTVPDGFDGIMADAGLLSYRVLYFERWETGLFQRPENYPEQSMVTVSTHDLPTLAGWWTGRDLQWRQELSLYPDDAMGQQDRNGRVDDRQMLLGALEDMAVLNRDKAPSASPAVMNGELSLAVQRYLAKAPSRIQLVPLEDALGLHEQVNIPGTIDEHPNWRQRLPVDDQQLWQHADMQALIKVMQQERPLGS